VIGLAALSSKFCRFAPIAEILSEAKDLDHLAEARGLSPGDLLYANPRCRITLSPL